MFSGLVRLSQSQNVMPIYLAVFFQSPLWSFLSEKMYELLGPSSTSFNALTL